MQAPDNFSRYPIQVLIMARLEDHLHTQMEAATTDAQEYPLERK